MSKSESAAAEAAARKVEAGTIHSPLVWGLLGLVIERPSYGYELAKRFKQVYDDTLVMSNRVNVYRLLDTLSGHGLIEEAAQPSKGKPAPNRLPKPTYHVTPRGTRAYEEWLVAQVQEELVRQALFVRQLVMLEPDKALEVLERYEQDYLEEGEQEPPSKAEGEAGIARDLVYEDERLKVGARLSWTRYARSELKSLLEQRATRR